MSKQKWLFFAHYRVRVDFRKTVRDILISDLAYLTLQNKSIIVSPYQKHYSNHETYPGEYILMPVHEKTIQLFEAADITHICSRDVHQIERILHVRKLIE